MSKKILTRLSLFLLVLFGITILTFIYTNLSPVDAAEALAVRRYSRPTPEQVELVREELGLDQTSDPAIWFLAVERVTWRFWKFLQYRPPYHRRTDSLIRANHHNGIIGVVVCSHI